MQVAAINPVFIVYDNCFQKFQKVFPCLAHRVEIAFQK